MFLFIYKENLWLVPSGKMALYYILFNVLYCHFLTGKGPILCHKIICRNAMKNMYMGSNILKEKAPPFKVTLNVVDLMPL